MENRFDVRPLIVVDHTLEVGKFKFQAFDLAGSATPGLTQQELNASAGPENLGLLERLCVVERLAPKTIFDVGANVGIWSLYAKLLNPNAQILAVEPIRELYEILVMNLLRSEKSIGHVNAAIAPAGQTEMTLGWHPTNTGGGSFQYAGILDHQATAPAVRVEDLMTQIGLDAVDFLKLDVEGMEYLILEDVKDWSRIKAMSVELHHLMHLPLWANQQVVRAGKDFLLAVHQKHGTTIEVRAPDETYIIGAVG